jgi:hypothetical protein
MKQSEKIQYDFIATVVEHWPTLELLDSLNQNFRQIDPNLLKNFSDILKPLIEIYRDVSRSPRLSIAAAKLIIYLCSYDITGDSITAIMNHDIITHISVNMNSYDYSLFHLSIMLLCVISEKVKMLKCQEVIGNNKYLVESLNYALVSAPYRDEPLFILNNITKVLYNLLASGGETNIILNKINNHVRDSIKSNENDDFEYYDNNIISNLIEYLKMPYFIKQKKDETKERFIHYLRSSDPDGLFNDERMINYKNGRDYRDFYKQCTIDEKIIKFFQLCLKGTHDSIFRGYYLRRYNLFRTLYDHRKIASMIAILYYYISVSNKKDKKEFEKDMLKYFHIFLMSIYRLFKFSFFLLDRDMQFSLEMIKKEYFKSFIKLYDIINGEKDHDLIKNVLSSDEVGKEFLDFLSTLHSLKTILYPPEQEHEIDVIINKIKR